MILRHRKLQPVQSEIHNIDPMASGKHMDLDIFRQGLNRLAVGSFNTIREEDTERAYGFLEILTANQK